MLSRWLQFGLAGLLSVLGAQAHADFFSESVKDHGVVMAYLKDSAVQGVSRENPMFGCYHIGRLQGVSDRLGKDISRYDSRAAVLSEAQFERLNLARDFYQGLEQTVSAAIDGKGCDSQSRTRLKELNGGKNSYEHIRLALAATQNMNAEDIIVRCLYIGRLSVLLESFREDIDARLRAGKSTSQENAAYRSAYNKVMSHQKSCGLDKAPRAGRGELDI